MNHEAEMSDLNIALIQNYLKEVKSWLYEKSKAGDFVEVCRDMYTICTLPEYTKPQNVGLMFFCMGGGQVLSIHADRCGTVSKWFRW